MEQVFLSRRNLLALLKKLDEKIETDPILFASVIKHDGQGKDFNQTMPIVCVTALEDTEYYGVNHVRNS
jgi:hypothetical protein